MVERHLPDFPPDQLPAAAAAAKPSRQSSPRRAGTSPTSGRPTFPRARATASSRGSRPAPSRKSNFDRRGRLGSSMHGTGWTVHLTRFSATRRCHRARVSINVARLLPGQGLQPAKAGRYASEIGAETPAPAQAGRRLCDQHPCRPSGTIRRSSMSGVPPIPASTPPAPNGSHRCGITLFGDSMSRTSGRHSDGCAMSVMEPAGIEPAQGFNFRVCLWNANRW
jgi:hypothetical protein